MKSSITLVLISILMHSYGQDIEGCDGQRYRDIIFEEVDTTKAVLYGAGEIYPTETSQELYYDVYTPVDDQLAERPVMIFAYGGSFIDGAREDMSWICHNMAQRGYVSVSIDYRLYGGPLFPPPSATQMKNVVMRAVSDMKGAIRHLKQNAANDNSYGIDPDKIFIGGISAGAILACHTSAIDSTDTFPEDLQMILAEHGGFEGNSNDITDFDSNIFGVINYSGGLNEAIWLDEKHPPIFSVHDENDPVVPFGDGSATIFGFPIIEMQGSKILHERAEEFNITNELMVFENSLSHVGYFLSENTTETVLNRTVAFTNKLLCPSLYTSTKDSYSSDIILYPNPTSGNVLIDSDQKIKTLKVANQMGQTVLTTTIPSLDISNFYSGLYTISITFENGLVVTKKIMKI